MRSAVVVLACLVAGLFLGNSSWAAEPPAGEKVGGVRSEEERIERLEEAVGRKVESDKWYDRIQLGGRAEVEAGYGMVDYGDPSLEDEDDSDVDLATVELSVDARIHANVDGHVLFKYEDDDVFVDEGFITLTGGEWCAGFLIVGRLYLPFGNFDTHFVTDPNTLVLGETNEGAAVAGYRFLEGKLGVSLSAFNGKAQQAGDDDGIDSYVAGVKARPTEELDLGIAYISNLASADSFNEEVVTADKEIASLVGGWSAYISYRFLARFKLIAEYVAALEHFEAGEIYAAADGRARKPSAWNTELGVTLLENLELAVRYGGADDGGPQFLPETQYGAVVNWGFFDHTNLALEYLRGEYEDDYQTTDAITAQLAVEF
ncbi:MAG: LbtU family siderophore porin [Desulfobacterales bacterium]|nr:LbtU family siderophore porin [Desulfobacterales bacterium]